MSRIVRGSPPLNYCVPYAKQLTLTRFWIYCMPQTTSRANDTRKHATQNNYATQSRKSGILKLTSISGHTRGGKEDMQKDDDDGKAVPRNQPAHFYLPRTLQSEDYPERERAREREGGRERGREGEKERKTAPVKTRPKGVKLRLLLPQRTPPPPPPSNNPNDPLRKQSAAQFSISRARTQRGG